MPLFNAQRALAYYGTLVGFGVSALLVNVGCVLLAWWPSSPAAERACQRLIHGFFAGLVRLLAWIRIARIEYRGFDRLQPAGAILVANHPGLLDAPFLLARVSRGVCLFKPAIRRNPLFGAVAHRAGYLAVDGAMGLVRAAADKARGGATLLIFPEGTRSPSPASLHPFHRGFAVIARAAGVPVQLIRIESDIEIMTREQPWWRLPQLPARIVVQAGPCLDPLAAASAAALVATAEDWFRSAQPVLVRSAADAGSIGLPAQPKDIPLPLSAH